MNSDSMKVVVIKPMTDTKGVNNMNFRLGVTRIVDLLLCNKKNIYEEIEKWNQNMERLIAF